MKTKEAPDLTGDDEALLTRDGVAARYAVHPKRLTAMVKAGRIPPPVEGWDGAQRRWLKSEIIAHIRGMRNKEKQEAAR